MFYPVCEDWGGELFRERSTTLLCRRLEKHCQEQARFLPLQFPASKAGIILQWQRNFEVCSRRLLRDPFVDLWPSLGFEVQARELAKNSGEMRSQGADSA